MEEPKEIILWLNGDKPDHIYTYYYWPNEELSTFQMFKNNIVEFFIEHNIKLHADYFNLYTIKEILLEEADIPYLVNKQILFILQSNETFSQSNHFYQYKFLKWIKSGGYGQVFLGKHIITQHEYAIKQINTESFSSQDLYNISRENIILQSFKHKNIIKCYHSFAYNNQFFTVMDFAQGGELGALIKEKEGLKEGEAKKIFKQIFNAVNYIHGKNIIHRDLKPNNIMFLNKERTEVVLIDFGISGFSNGNSKEKIMAGTVRFHPPEMANGTNFTSSPKIDVWALGVILYYMLYNVFPFNGKTDKEINEAIINSSVVFHRYKKISEECSYLIIEMLQKNPLFRIGIDSETFFQWFNKKEEPTKENRYSNGNIYKKKSCDNIKRYSIMPLNNGIRKHLNDFLLMNEDNDSDNESRVKITKKNSQRLSMIRKTKTVQLPYLMPNQTQAIKTDCIKKENVNNNYLRHSINHFIKKKNSFISPVKSFRVMGGSMNKELSKNYALCKHKSNISIQRTISVIESSRFDNA